MKLVFATSNPNKVKEISSLIGDDIQLLGLKDIACTEDIPETSDTIEGNAIQKAQYIYDNYGVNCFAEDTGLEVISLNMEPGVRTARYAGESKDDNANMNKVLAGLTDKADRSARFKTVIAYIKDGKVETFEGIANGEIAKELQGNDGFGYDPIFIPEGETRSFAQMTRDEKNLISHRAKALQSFLVYLNS